MSEEENILEVRDLVTEFEVDGRWLRAVDGVNFVVPKGYLTKPDGTRLQIKISWGQYPTNDKMMALLKEDARKAGLAILLDSQQSTVYFRQILEKRHQVCYTGWGVTPPFPRYYGSFHSSNAYDKKGNVKQQTNNLNVYADPEMDKMVETVRNGRTVEEIERAAKVVHDAFGLANAPTEA